MKKLIQTLTLVFFAAILTACGDGPEKTAKTFFEEMLRGDAGKAVELIYLPPEATQKGMNEEAIKGKLTMMAAEMQQQIKKEGGDISISTGEVTYTNAAKSEAKIAVTLYKHINGKKARRDAEILLIKEDGAWKVLKPDT